MSPSSGPVPSRGRIVISPGSAVSRVRLVHDEKGAVVGRAASRSGRTIANHCARIEHGDDSEQTTGNEFVHRRDEVRRE